MHWSFSADIPIYLQIVRQLETCIASGSISRGERMPSVRDLAVEAQVNPNTMQKAFAELEKRGIVYSKRTAGRFVTDDPVKIAELKRELARRQTDEFLSAMGRLGMTGGETLALLRDMIGEEEGKENFINGEG